MKFQTNGFNDKDVIKKLVTQPNFRSCDVNKINKKSSKFFEPPQMRNYKFIGVQWRKENTWTKNDQCKCDYCDYEAPQYLMKWHHRAFRKLGSSTKAAEIQTVPLCSACVDKEITYV